MKKSVSKLVTALLLALAICVTGVIGNEASVDAKTKVKISNTRITLTVGQSKTLKVKGTKKKPKWSSSKKSVATVSKKGKVVAKKAGSATITAKIGKKKYKCKVTVKNKKKQQNTNTVKPSTPTQNQEIKLNNIKIKNAKDIYLEEERQLGIEKNPSNATNKKIQWTSSDPAIVSVTSDGKIVGKKAGNAEITASADGVSDSCWIKVSPRMSTPNTHVTVKRGQDIEIPITFYGDGNGKLDAKIYGVGYASGEWVRKEGQTGYLKLTGEKVGNGRVEFTNSINSEKVIVYFDVTGYSEDFHVTVENTLPTTLKCYSSYFGNTYTKLNVTDITCQYEDLSTFDGVQLKVKVTGTKTYDSDGESGTYMCAFVWKLYDENNVIVKSGDSAIRNLRPGETGVTEFTVANDLPSGNYRLVLGDRDI